MRVGRCGDAGTARACALVRPNYVVEENPALATTALCDEGAFLQRGKLVWPKLNPFSVMHTDILISSATHGTTLAMRSNKQCLHCLQLHLTASGGYPFPPFPRPTQPPFSFRISFLASTPTPPPPVGSLTQSLANSLNKSFIRPLQTSTQKSFQIGPDESDAVRLAVIGYSSAL